MLAPIQIVTAFMDRWSESNDAMVASFGEYLTPDTIWENVGIAVTTGVEEALALLAATGADTVVVEMLAIAAAGNLVLTERVDRLILADGTERVALRLMGVFEVEEGKIVRWRDYYDSAAVPGVVERMNPTSHG